MNITFLVGNGFDINLGLDTKYTDFYPYYCGKKHNDMLGKAIADNYECWADLEAELGRFLSCVNPNQIDEFLDSKATLEADLANYLLLEEERLDLSKANVINTFQKNLSEFYSEFSSRERGNYQNWSKQISDRIRYQFISFNYTSALDRIVSEARGIKEFSSHIAGSTRYIDEVGDILHIHGTLSGDLILALDNAKQIANPDLQSNPRITEYIVKSAINEALGEEKTEKAKRLITDSDYVCVYGMSFGDTDLMWWKYLLNWLQRKNSHKLVLYIYADKTKNPSGTEKLRQQDQWRDFFLRKVGAKDDIMTNLRGQVIVVLRSKIFDFNGIVKPKATLGESLSAIEEALAAI